MEAEYRLHDKLEYYSDIFYYVDDILCMHHDPHNVLNKLNLSVPLKSGSGRTPDMHLNTELKHMQIHHGILAWSTKLVQETVRIAQIWRYP